jgi:predicted alpha/beta-hydrolase family hydrolase
MYDSAWPVKSSPAVKVDIDTPHGPARALVQPAAERVGALVLGHGAAGGFGAPDLVTATKVALELGFTVALVEQPYLVAGRRSPAPAAQLDAAWTAAVERLRGSELDGLPLVVGGRSAGARVACRTARQAGAVAVLCLAFPVHAPGRDYKTRLPELDAVTLPTLVVQGNRDPFGMPPPGPNRTVVPVNGNHTLKSDLDSVAAAVRDWLPGVVG